MQVSVLLQHLDQASPRAAVRNDLQQSGAPQEAAQSTCPQAIQQPRQNHGPQGDHLLNARLTQSQDQLPADAGVGNPTLGLGPVPAPDHLASQLSTTPILAPKQGIPVPAGQLQSATQAHPSWTQSSSSQPSAAVLCNTPVLSVSQSNIVATPSTGAPELGSVRTQLSCGRTPSLAAAEQQYSFSAMPADNTDESLEAELSPMQRALRSLSSKGLQTNRSPSGKDSGDARALRDGSSVSPGKLSLGSWHGQHLHESPNEAEVGNGGYSQGVGDEGVQEPLSQRVGAVRELASRLNLRSNSSKHMS